MMYCSIVIQNYFTINNENLFQKKIISNYKKFKLIIVKESMEKHLQTNCKNYVDF